MNSCLSKAIEEEIIFKNPTTKILKDVIRTEEKTKHPLNPVQQTKLLNYVRENNYYQRFEPMLVVLFGTGMRTDVGLHKL